MVESIAARFAHPPNTSPKEILTQLLLTSDETTSTTVLGVTSVMSHFFPVTDEKKHTVI